MDAKPTRPISNRTPLLDQIDLPADLRKLPEEDLRQLADELRAELIDAVSITGGHFGASLGVVELTVALHYVFDTPRDRLIWDVGHQAYPHKILTGRRDRIRTLRQAGGLSGFCKRAESEYDTFGAGHSSTSISAVLGMAVARDLSGKEHNVIAVIGDGAMSAGMAYEAMNNAGAIDSRLMPHPIEIKPSPPNVVMPDELMILWGDTPASGAATLYLPSVSAAQVIHLADQMYGLHRLTLQDAHTLRCQTAGATFVPIPVGSRALDVLDVLLDRAGNLVLRDELMAAVWPATAVEDTNLNMQIATLRRLLDHGRRGGSYIQTVPKVGYRFAASVSPAQTKPAAAVALIERIHAAIRIIVFPFRASASLEYQQHLAYSLAEAISSRLVTPREVSSTQWIRSGRSRPAFASSWASRRSA